MNSGQLSIADLAGGGLKLIELRVMLAGDLTLRGLAIKVRAGTVIQGRVHIDPHGNVGIPRIRRGWGWIRQSQSNQDLIKKRNLGCRRSLPLLGLYGRRCCLGSLWRT